LLGRSAKLDEKSSTTDQARRRSLHVEKVAADIRAVIAQPAMLRVSHDVT